MFAFRVAKELGWFNVSAMLESAPAGMLSKWSKFFAQDEDKAPKLDLDGSGYESMTGL